MYYSSEINVYIPVEEIEGHAAALIVINGLSKDFVLSIVAYIIKLDVCVPNNIIVSIPLLILQSAYMEVNYNK